MGCLVSDGADAAQIAALRASVTRAGGELKIIAPKIGGVVAGNGQLVDADYQLAGGPSVLFDAVAIVAGPSGAPGLMREAAAVAFVHDAYAHLKVIGATDAATGLLKQAGVNAGDPGVISLSATSSDSFVDAAKHGRIWSREASVRQVV